jgi:hypothetical protein
MCSADTLAAGLFQKGAFGFRRTANGTGACFQTSVCLTFCTCFCASPFRMGETYWATGTVEFLCPCVWNALNAFFSGGLSEIPKVSKRGLWGGSNYIQAPAGLLQWGHLEGPRAVPNVGTSHVFVPNFLGMGETYWIVRVLSYFIREVFAFIYESKVKTQNSKQMVWAGFEKKVISLQN